MSEQGPRAVALDLRGYSLEFCDYVVKAADDAATLLADAEGVTIGDLLRSEVPTRRQRLAALLADLRTAALVAREDIGTDGDP